MRVVVGRGIWISFGTLLGLLVYFQVALGSGRAFKPPQDLGRRAIYRFVENSVHVESLSGARLEKVGSGMAAESNAGCAPPVDRASYSDGAVFSIHFGFKQREQPIYIKELSEILAHQFERYTRPGTEITVNSYSVNSREAVLDVYVEHSKDREKVKAEILKLLNNNAEVSFAGEPGIASVQ